jgi:alkylation response protein AidB-like acyl-CoA dehydrogenase
VSVTQSIDDGCLARARAAAKLVAPWSSRIESERRLPPEAVAALVDVGVFKLFVPRELGGHEATVATMVAVLEELARGDGALGWCGMIAATSSLMCGFLPADVAREVYGPAAATTCGVFAPLGRATPVEGGYRVSGLWPFASGCEHSQWRMGGTIVDGRADEVRSMLFRAEETRVIDTWDTSGLRGTGSHDLEVTDVFVPASRSFSLLTDQPRATGALVGVPFFGALAAGVAAVALGIGRAAVDALVQLAQVKHPLGARRSIAHRELVQLAVARAEARLTAGRAYLDAAVAAATAEAGAQGVASVATRAQLRLAACHAATEAAAATDLMYDAAGATSIYARSPLQRCFRDVHVATQHIMVSPTAAMQVGKLLLGVETDVATL